MTKDYQVISGNVAFYYCIFVCSVRRKNKDDNIHISSAKDSKITYNSKTPGTGHFHSSNRRVAVRNGIFFQILGDTRK